ncbi:MAG: YdjY domain-containing protein [Phycisphaerales bacterium]|nr:YdjY domain-containing protein [Phycisphaerales bacterium]
MGWPGVITALMMHNASPLSTDLVGAHEVFPGVRINADKTIVEFDAAVSPALVRDARAPRFYLEVLICAPNTREHESFLVTTVKPSHIHAAMLVIGLNHGTPGRWVEAENRLNAIQPTGDRVDVRFVFASDAGKRVVADPLNWIIRAEDALPFTRFESTQASNPGWVFAGSRFVSRPLPDGQRASEVYDADGAGIILGLTTFGSEVIGWSRMISPEAAVEAPAWIADFDKTPKPGTPVAVRIAKTRPPPTLSR